MNPTPCPLCNHLLLKRLQAFVKREWKELERYENEHAAHRASCALMADGWYLGLWPAAQVVKVEG